MASSLLACNQTAKDLREPLGSYSATRQLTSSQGSKAEASHQTPSGRLKMPLDRCPSTDVESVRPNSQDLQKLAPSNNRRRKHAAEHMTWCCRTSRHGAPVTQAPPHVVARSAGMQVLPHVVARSTGNASATTCRGTERRYLQSPPCNNHRRAIIDVASMRPGSN